MKKIFFLAVTIGFLFSCEEERKDYAIISGTIQNGADKINLWDKYDNSKTEIKVNKDGTFVDTISIGDQNHFMFIENRNRLNLYLSKGTSLEVNYNAQSLDSTLNFVGEEAKTQEYLRNKIKKSSSLNQSYLKGMYLKNEGEFTSLIEGYKDTLMLVLKNATGLNDGFKNEEKVDINYSGMQMVSSYERAHAYYAKIKDYKVSDTISNLLKDLDVNNETHFTSSQNYRRLLSNHFNFMTNEIVERDSIEFDIAGLKALESLESQKIKNSLLFQKAEFGITYTNSLEEYYKMFSEMSTDTVNNKIIDGLYSQLKTLASGNDSPKFTDYENYKGGTTSLEDLKGKYTYIDVWATWCGPCIAEIPSLKKLEKDYHDKNIQFVSISIDRIKDHEKWKKMIEDRELGGIQLFADKDWESKFVQDYLIKGIPRFILLDPEGKIVDANAQRPSNNKLRETFAKNNI